jgi:hypothetical protein
MANAREIFFLMHRSLALGLIWGANQQPLLRIQAIHRHMPVIRARLSWVDQDTTQQGDNHAAGNKSEKRQKKKIRKQTLFPPHLPWTQLSTRRAIRDARSSSGGTP